MMYTHREIVNMKNRCTVNKFRTDAVQRVDSKIDKETDAIENIQRNK